MRLIIRDGKSSGLIHLCLFIVGIGISIPSYGQQKVRVWEEPLTLPTYLVKKADKNPMFFTNQSYQGASRYIYPYALSDNITDEKIDKTYKALYLENEYIKLCVLPEIGGRLAYATDKTNGYEIFYRQHVIKPANIGMLGAWISGGIEFCVFHHHRASTNMEVDYKLKQNDDGSATIWIGETEPRHRMKWTLGISLFPGKSYIEVDGRLINPTENINSILYWANVATHVNDDYQVFFPPSTDFAVYHAKNSFAHWPITTEAYNGHEYYRDSLDASWWKNHPNSISMFAHEMKDGFLAGYDFGKNAGTMHVGNHHIVKGAKLWEWSNSVSGTMWDSKVLTDNDGPYAELMAGAYSDNQPDYSWLKPYELKTFKQYWYPLRKTEGAVAANLDATLNLKKLGNGDFILAANTTQKFENATITLRKGDETLFESTINMAPENPFSKELHLGNMVESELTLTLIQENGDELISYQPVNKKANLPLPDPVVPPKDPEEIESLEELYLTGQRIKQFHNARMSPVPYFEEALRRDSMDVRSNTMMGLILKEEFKLEEAVSHFRMALKRLTANYTRPRNCEPFYHLGVILKQQGKLEAAYDTLYRAAWDQSFASAAYFQLAQISSIGANFSTALVEINRSLEYNASNLNALNLKATILRISATKDEARKLVAEILQKDPLNFRAMHEAQLLGDITSKDLVYLLRDNPESYLELAVEYLNSGFSGEALTILQLAANSDNKVLSTYPTIHYYLGAIHSGKGNSHKSKAHFSLASNISTDYCFPYRFETIAVYKSALKTNPNDARAYYYLGNLLYDKQPKKAIGFWEKAVKLEPSLAIAHRNLGWGYNQTFNDPVKAIAAYEMAIQHDQTQARYYVELDRLYEQLGTDIEKRYKLLTKNHEYVSQRPDAFLHEIKVLSLYGENQRAIEYFTNNFFPKQEGAESLHETYVDACLAQGIEELGKGEYASAMDYFLKADEYPENHQEARDDSYEKNTQIYFYQSVAAEKLKDKKRSKALIKKVSGLDIMEPEYTFYKALALKKLGNKKEALGLAAEIESRGSTALTVNAKIDFFSKFGEGQSESVRQAKGNYLLALAFMIRGEEMQAKERLESAIKLNPNHLWIKLHLNELEENVPYIR